MIDANLMLCHVDDFSTRGLAPQLRSAHLHLNPSALPAPREVRGAGDTPALHLRFVQVQVSVRSVQSRCRVLHLLSLSATHPRLWLRAAQG